MPEHKPHHQLVLWAAEHAPDLDWFGHVFVYVPREAFNLLLREGMESVQEGKPRTGKITIDERRKIYVWEGYDPSDIVLCWNGKPFYTLQLTAHQKLAFAAAVEAARAEKEGEAP